MKEHLATLLLTALVSVSLISCDLSVDGHGNYIASEITIDGTADSTWISSYSSSKTIIYEKDYPYTYWIGYWEGTGASSADGYVYNISDTGYVYVTEIYNSRSRPDTTYYTIEPNNFLSLR